MASDHSRVAPKEVSLQTSEFRVTQGPAYGCTDAQVPLGPATPIPRVAQRPGSTPARHWTLVRTALHANGSPARATLRAFTGWVTVRGRRPNSYR
ncbi:hypothetical protein EVAR_54061_1 [Eumeta japonica]|uniref:Uncharacterized protein n=1 Tax=Eumeta variegata TaxID=151549 RepID=A0A4C1XDU5_EUMVA|nr:hypothetical protein EVAR_54061_1 [Eumeta japonica]